MTYGSAFGGYSTIGQTIRFGKHKGKRWEDVPADYLAWMCRNEDMNPHLREAARYELDRREGCDDFADYARRNAPASEAERKLAAIVPALKDAYRQASMRCHPDRGGSNEKQAAVNEFYELLTENLRKEGIS